MGLVVDSVIVSIGTPSKRAQSVNLILKIVSTILTLNISSMTSLAEVHPLLAFYPAQAVVLQTSEGVEPFNDGAVPQSCKHQVTPRLP